MLKRIDGGVYLSKDGKLIEASEGQKLYGEACDAREKTMSYSIMRNHSKTNYKDKMKRNIYHLSKKIETNCA